MYQLILAIYLAFACHGHNHTTQNNNGQFIVMDNSGGNGSDSTDTGGENGHIPPNPPGN
jgi:uncharacterized protein YcfL